MDAFHFKERLALFGNSAVAIISASRLREHFRTRIGRTIRNYYGVNQRLLKYRNFVVRGPRGRVDELAVLRSWELKSIFLDDDLWLDYNTEFKTVRSEWTSLARGLVRSMESALAEIQLLNENSIEKIAFDFLKSRPCSL
jgi:hypothetical protein